MASSSGVTFDVVCTGEGFDLRVHASSGSGYMSGTQNEGNTSVAIERSFQDYDAPDSSLHVIAYDSRASPRTLSHFDVAVVWGGTLCSAFGMVIPG